MRCLEGTSVGFGNGQTSANLTLRQLGGNGSRLIAPPECVTPTRVEPAPWCHRPERRVRIWTGSMQRYRHRSRTVRCGLDDAFA
jgi:hypothetical protein